MVPELTVHKLPMPAALRRGVRYCARVATVVLVLCGLAGASLHVHHGPGSETCTACVHARTPATTAAITALPLPAQPVVGLVLNASVTFAPAPCFASADSRAPPSPAPAA